MDDITKSLEQITEGWGITDFGVIPHWETNEHYVKEMINVKNEYRKKSIETICLKDGEGYIVNNDDKHKVWFVL